MDYLTGLMYPSACEVLDAFTSRNEYAACLPASMLLAALLRKKGFADAHINDGFVVAAHKYALRHVWVVCRGIIIDPGSGIIARLLGVPLTLSGFVAVVPDGMRQMDKVEGEDFEERRRLEAVIQYARTDPRAYWMYALNSKPQLGDIMNELRLQPAELTLQGMG